MNFLFGLLHINIATYGKLKETNTICIKFWRISPSSLFICM